MLDQIRPYLAMNETTVMQEYRQRQAHVGELNKAIREYKELVAKNQAGLAEESWSQYVTRIASSAASYVTHPFSQNEPEIRRRDYGWGTGTIIDSYTALYYVNGSQARTPGAYAMDDKHAATGQTNEQVHLKWQTNEQVHPTVGYRLAKTKNETEAKLKYTPIGMDEKKFFRRKNKDGAWEYSINGVILPEYTLKRGEGLTSPNGPTFEVLAIEGDEAREYVEKLYGMSIQEYLQQ